MLDFWYSDPQVANRVRVLKFMPGHLFKLLKESEEAGDTRESTLSSVLASASLGSNMGERPSGSNRSRRRHVMKGAASSTQRFSLSTSGTTSRSMGSIIKQPPIAPDDALEQLTAGTEKLTSLITLQVEIRSDEHYYMDDCKALIFDFVWPAIAPSLRNLELKIPMEDMALVLPNYGEITLVRLESLYLRIIRASLSTAEQPIILDVLVPFLTAHRASLHSLTLDIVEQTDLSVFLLAAHLPQLREFKLKIPLASPTDRRFTALQSFFRSHRTQLTTFDIELVPTFTHRFADQAFFDQDHFTTYRPKLQHLNINTPSHNASMSAYILQFRWTLVSLRVHCLHRWSLESLRTVVEAFLPTGTLKRLDVAVFEFSPELLVALAINLPNLDVLSLDIESVIPQGTTYSTLEGESIPLVSCTRPNFAHTCSTLTTEM